MSDNEVKYRQLIVKAQQGDAAAYGELLSDISLFLKNYLRRKIFERGDIEEVVQEILMALHKSLHTYNSEKAFMSWLMAITEYKVIDYIRDVKKRAMPSDLEALTQSLAGVYTDPDLKMEIEKAINRLGEKEKTVLALLKIEGQSVNEVAQKLNLTEANVKVIAHRAYVNLQTYLGVRS